MRHEHWGYMRGSKAKRVFSSTFSLLSCLGFPWRECTAGITGNKSWCYHHTSTSKQSPLTQKHKNSSAQLKQGQKHRLEKWCWHSSLMFGACNGHADAQRHNKTAARFVDTPIKLYINIKNRQKRRLNTEITPLHNNARPQIAELTQSMLTMLKFKVLSHLVYSSDLSPYDY